MRALLTALSMLLLLICPRTACAQYQTGKTLTEQAYARAREVMERGIRAMGGLDSIQAIQSVSLNASAEFPEIGQSANPDAPLYVRLETRKDIMDFAQQRTYQWRETRYLGGSLRATAVVTSNQKGFVADLASGAVYPLAPAAVPPTASRLRRTLSPFLVVDALNRAGTLRSLGRQEFQGRMHDVIGFVDPDGRPLSLYFDTSTGLLTKTEALSDNLLTGLTSVQTIFSDYRRIHGVEVPFRIVSRLGPQVLSDVRNTEVAVNSDIDAHLFEQPVDAEPGPVVGGPPPPLSITKLGNDVYVIDAIGTGGVFFYSAMFVVLKDYALVLEAPLSNEVSQAVIAKIKETAPGRSIRYVIPTHYHTDHLGGIREFIAEGATIVTTPGNRRFIEQLASISHPLLDDRLTRTRRSPTIETFERKRVFADDAHSVELYNIGPTPHVDEMVIAYFPKEKALFVTDLFMVSYKGRIQPADTLNLLLYSKIHELGLDVATIVSGHGRVGTMADLEQAVAARRHS